MILNDFMFSTLTQRQLFCCLLCKFCLQKFMQNLYKYDIKLKKVDIMVNFYETKQAAKILHLSPEVLTRKCRNGEITYKRSGRKYLFAEEDINKFIISGGKHD